MTNEETGNEAFADPTEAAFDRLRHDAEALDPMDALRSYELRRSPAGLSATPSRGWGWRFSLVAACLVVVAGAGIYFRPNSVPDLDTAAPVPPGEVDEVVEAERPQEASEPETTSRAATDRITTASILTANPEFPVQFFADNDDCGRSADERSHPDWDPSPTEDHYPFASTEGELGIAADWRFLESPLALSGDCLLSLSADTSGEADGASQVGQPIDADEFYLSTWLYFPDEIAFDRSRTIDGTGTFGFWQGIQISGVFDGDPANTQSSIVVTIGRLNDEEVMNAELFVTVPCGRQDDCPEGLSVDSPDPQPVPVGRWVHFEIRMVIGGDETGIVQIWQDGESIIEYRGNTLLTGADGHVWAIRNKGDLVTTGPSTVLVEDVLLSADAVHPLLFP